MASQQRVPGLPSACRVTMLLPGSACDLVQHPLAGNRTCSSKWPGRHQLSTVPTPVPLYPQQGFWPACTELLWAAAQAESAEAPCHMPAAWLHPFRCSGLLQHLLLEQQLRAIQHTLARNSTLPGTMLAGACQVILSCMYGFQLVLKQGTQHTTRNDLTGTVPAASILARPPVSAWVLYANCYIHV